MDSSTGNHHYDALAQAQVIDAVLSHSGKGNGGLSFSRRTSMDYISDVPFGLGSTSLPISNDPWNSPVYSRSNSLDLLEATSITDQEIDQLVSEIKSSLSSGVYHMERRNSLEYMIRNLSCTWAAKKGCSDPLLVESRANTLRRLSLTVLDACNLTTGTIGDVNIQPTTTVSALTRDHSACHNNTASAEAAISNTFIPKRRMSSLSLMASMVECPPDADQNNHFEHDSKRQRTVSSFQERRSTLDFLASTLLANEYGSNPTASSYIDSDVYTPASVNSVFPRYLGDTSIPQGSSTLMPAPPNLAPSVQSLLLQSLSASMKATEESKRLMEEWDKRMGLKRSHSITVRNTSRSRKMLQELMMGGYNL